MAFSSQGSMTTLKILAFLILNSLLISCGKNQTAYRFAAGSPVTSYYAVAKSIAEIAQKEYEIKIDVLSEPVRFNGDILTLGSIANCKLLLNGDVDFAIAQNDVQIKIRENKKEKLIDTDIRSILPLYSEIFFIIYKNNLNPNTLKDLIIGRNIAMGPRNSGTAKLAKILFNEFGIDSTEYRPIYRNFEDNMLSDSIDICCMVTGFNNPRIEKLLSNNGKLFSLGNYQLANSGSTIDGFCLKYPLAKPYIIPKNTYEDRPEQPILTAAIDAVLLTRKDVPDKVVNSVIRSILINKQLIALDNKLLSQLTEGFDPLKLRFPLHPGARQYLERDKPSFLERYAEMFGFIFSIIIAIIGGVTTFARWNKKRKKNRIDVYYEKLISIQKTIEHYNTIEECDSGTLQLKQLRLKAFEQLISEQLSADESFRIFITYLNDILAEIERKTKALPERCEAEIKKS